MIVLMRMTVFVGMAMAARMAVAMVRVGHRILHGVVGHQVYNDRGLGDMALVGAFARLKAVHPFV